MVVYHRALETSRRTGQTYFVVVAEEEPWEALGTGVVGDHEVVSAEETDVVAVVQAVGVGRGVVDHQLEVPQPHEGTVYVDRNGSGRRRVREGVALLS